MYTYSIIIPHKNTPKLLQRCLNSIPYRDDIQIIIIDDDSDSSYVDFKNFPGYNRKNVEIYFTKEGKGVGYARNIGLQKAKGKWLLFADSDDFFNPNFLYELDKYKDSNEEIIYYLATSVESNSLQKSIRHLYLLKTRKKYYKKLRYNKIKAKDQLIYKNWEVWAKMFNRNFIEKNNLIFDEERIGEEALFVIKAGELSKNYFVDDFPLYCITYRKDSLCFSLDNEDEFDERFMAKIRINTYLKKVKKEKFTIDLDKDLLESYNYGGAAKMKEIMKIIKNNGNKIRLKTYVKYYIRTLYNPKIKMYLL
ncbi:MULTISPECIES: glycosyltransferase family 2 protein [unclassified Apibacter]|uniref:glycosyltransferase family 2 protein n=1 Tax=unclassified Apibacter TaxID=2630820 RepID=UPI00135EBE7E|nr:MULTISPECIES: glycosyltransferase family 2 protein [unclassified Apibacter]MXP05475.1 glycosyltransferase [Apibacter sp. B3546]MXP12440.1 glycosyltransferase [Apibacter sp. B3239]